MALKECLRAFTFGVILLISPIFGQTFIEQEADQDKPLNVLLIVVDDMRAEATPFLNHKERPWLNSNIITPNWERLAERSMIFTRAYAQVSRCNPSRSSFLTGRRPDTTKVHLNDVNFRNTTKAHLITLPEFFRRNGYTTTGLGKTFHIQGSAHVLGDPDSWSIPSQEWETPYNNEREYTWYGVPNDDSHPDPLEDERLKLRALERLDEFSTAYKEKGEPFFLMLGFHKPHLPLNLPQRFLQKYPLSDVSPAKHDHSPRGFPSTLWTTNNELYGYADNADLCDGSWEIGCKMPEEEAKAVRRAYYGCVTYIDALIGEVLDKTDEQQMWNNTVIVVTSDHGFHLGENGWWGKTMSLEAGLHVPLMITVPGLTTERRENNELVELVDLYPTLLEATGHPVPSVCPLETSGEVSLCREGSSLVPLLRGNDELEWKGRVFSEAVYPEFSKTSIYKAYTMRTKEYRYTEWVDYTDGVQTTWPDPAGVELYDLEKDPNQLKNKSEDPDYQSIREELSKLLHQGWVGAQPKHE